MVTNDRDLGCEVVRHVYGVMQVDERWSVREERGFTWWGHTLAQRVWAEPKRTSRGHDVWLLRVESELFRGVPDGPATLELLSRANGQAALDAVVFDPGRQRVVLCSSFIVHAGILPWAQRIFPLVVALQAEKASSLLKRGVASVFRGTVDASVHPSSGERCEPDEMLSVVDDHVGPAGRGESPFGEADFALVQRYATQNGASASTGRAGVSLEVPLAEGERPASEVMAQLLGGRGEVTHAGTALITAKRTDRHVRLGSGCQLTLRMPTLLDILGTRTLAAELNRLEATQWTGGGHLLGGWHETTVKALGVDTSVLAFSTFIPAFAYGGHVLANFVMSLWQRAEWAARQNLWERA